MCACVYVCMYVCMWMYIYTHVSDMFSSRIINLNKFEHDICICEWFLCPSHSCPTIPQGPILLGLVPLAEFLSARIAEHIRITFHAAVSVFSASCAVLPWPCYRFAGYWGMESSMIWVSHVPVAVLEEAEGLVECLLRAIVGKYNFVPVEPFGLDSIVLPRMLIPALRQSMLMNDVQVLGALL